MGLHLEGEGLPWPRCQRPTALLTRTVHGSKREADAQLRQLILEAGLANETSHATMEDLAAKWLELSSETLSPSTLREYRRLLVKISFLSLGA